MPTALADPADVRVEIDTKLTDPDILDVLDRVARDIERAYGSSPGFSNDGHRRDFEATLAALQIATGRDRTASQESLGNWNQTYEADRVEELRDRVRSLDPGDEFGHPTGQQAASFEVF